MGASTVACISLASCERVYLICYAVRTIVEISIVVLVILTVVPLVVLGLLFREVHQEYKRTISYNVSINRTTGEIVRPVFASVHC